MLTSAVGPVFLVGAPRSGATAVCAVLNEAGVDTRWDLRDATRISTLAEDPATRFVLVVRSPVLTVSSLILAWNSRRFVSEPDLPGWWGEPWSFPLVDGWEALIGAPTAQVCARQWAALTASALDGLATLPAERWTVCSFDALLTDPQQEIGRVLGDLGLPSDVEVPLPIPVADTVVTPPGSVAWRGQLGEVLDALERERPMEERLRGVISERRPGFTWPALAQPTGPERTTMPSADTAFSSSHSTSFAELLRLAGASIAISTYKSGHVIVARANGDVLDTEATQLERAMGIAAAGTRLAVGGADSIVAYSAHAGLGDRIPSPVPADAVYAIRSIVMTGDIAIHDMAYAPDGTLYFVNTSFSCLCRQDIDYSFVPLWQPAWISRLAAEDRCHLNGLALVDGQPRYVTALAQTDTPHGWREQRGTGGVIVDITAGTLVSQGLAMPHSPRWHDGRLWVLESGRGALCTVDLQTGERTDVALLPGFTRGLAFLGRYALVGLSQVRESVFTGLPITDSAAERNCGVWVVDTQTGGVVALLKFTGAVSEVFEVTVLPARWPVLVKQSDLTRTAYVLSDEAIAATRPAAGWPARHQDLLPSETAPVE